MEKELAPAVDGLAELLIRVERALADRPHSHAETSLTVSLCLRFGLTRGEARGLAKLMERGFVSRQNLHRATSHPASKIKTVDAIICKLRAKLALYDITIDTVFAQGFVLDKSARDRINRMLAAHDAGIISTAAPSAETGPTAA